MKDEINSETVQSEPIAPSWFIDEGVPGVGDRPAWLSDKFKSAADLAKSYSELERKVGTAPEEYDLSGSKFLDQDYEPIQEMLKLAREKRVPKEVIDKMADSIDKYMDEFSIDMSEETKKLGENAPERLKVLDNWAKANLSDKAYDALCNNLKSADSILALEELRGKMMSGVTMVPGGNDADVNGAPTLDELKSELSANLAKYKSDPAYRKDLSARLEIAAKSSNILDKSGY